MRHGVDGRYFGRNTSHRVAMLKNLGNNLIIHDQIITTIEKAKETRRVVERLITLAKKGTLNCRRISFDRTRDKDVVKKLFDELVPRYKDRKGGYTRIVKVSETRWGDAAKMAMIELVDHPKIDRKKKIKEVTATEGAADGPTADPFSKMRKLFGGKKTASTGTKAEKVAKAPKTPKAPKAAKPAAKKTASRSS